MDTDFVRDALTTPTIVASERVFNGVVWDVRTDVVDLGEQGQVRRDFVDHTGAVAVVALNDAGEVLLLRQYRHPVQSYLWELPAGLLDVPGEPWVSAAKRELAEEADLTASEWHTLVDYYTSPGGSDEFIRIFLARGIGEVPEAERHVREAEEADMVPAWVPLSEAVNKVFAGDLHNPSTVLGILAAHIGSQENWVRLRPADAPFELKKK